jgi:hypothetical protein
MELLRRYVQSTSRHYSPELAIFLLICYAVLFGISIAMLIRNAMNHNILEACTAGFFAVMGLAFLFVEAQVVRGMASRS